MSPAHSDIRSGGWKIGLVLLASILVSGCVIGTAIRLLQTRSQLLDFDHHHRFVSADYSHGPGFVFLDPRLTREDIRTIASGREPSLVDSLDNAERWIFRYVRRPPMRGKAINLELHFHRNRLSGMYVDRRFAEDLGNERIEMLLRTFVGRETQLDLSERSITCEVSEDKLRPFPALDHRDLVQLFGRENYSKRQQSDSLYNRLVFRYRLVGASGRKANMSFSATVEGDSRRLLHISSRIGSFKLKFDLSAQPVLDGEGAIRADALPGRD